MQSLFFEWLSAKKPQLSKKGSLKEQPAYVVLFWAAQQNFTGTIGFERGKRIKYVSIKQGKVFRIQTNIVMESLDIALKKGILPPHHVDELLKGMDQTDTLVDWDHKILSELKRKGIFDQSTSEDFLFKQTQQRLINLLGWFEGDYIIHEQQRLEIPDKSALPWIDLNECFQQLDLFLNQGKTLFWDNALTHDQPIELLGELSQHSGGFVMFYFSARKASGQLLLERGQRRKAFRLSQGKITSIVSSDPKETLDTVLLRWHYLPENIVTQITRRVRSEKKKLRETLLQEKYLTPEQVEEAMRVLHAERILEAFAWRSGSYEFKGEIATPEPLDDTERDALPPKDVTSLALVTTSKKVVESFQQMLSENTPEIVSLTLPEWRDTAIQTARALTHELNASGLKTLLVCTPDHRLMPQDPSEWDNLKDWETHLEPKSDDGFMCPLLYLSDRKGTWSSYQGSEILSKLVAALQSKYDLIVWLTSLKDSHKNILQLGKVILLVDNKSKKDEVVKNLTLNNQLQFSGFIFDATI